MKLIKRMKLTKKKKTYQPNFLLSLSLKLNHIEVILI
jgi:hypothetical protein